MAVHPYPAVQADGSVNAGLKVAIMYTWYPPKGRSTKFRRRHFWETAVVWIDDPALENSTVLAVTLNSGWRDQELAPVEPEFLDGSSVKLDSYRGFGFPKPKLQPTEQDGEFQDLITWEQLTEEARNALSTADFSQTLIQQDKREMPLKDGIFEERLEDAWPF